MFISKHSPLGSATLLALQSISKPIRTALRLLPYACFILALAAPCRSAVAQTAPDPAPQSVVVPPTPQPASPRSPHGADPAHYELYAGWALIKPIGSSIDGTYYPSISNKNATISLSDYFTHRFGVQVESGYFSGGSKHGVPTQCQPSCSARDQLMYTIEMGPTFHFTKGRFEPFALALGGGAKVNGPVDQKLTWGWGVTVGGGLDYVPPILHNYLAVRLFQTDFQYSRVNYGPLVASVNQTGGLGSITAFKVSAGLVLHVGDYGTPPVAALTCSAAPATAYPGDPILLTAAAEGLSPKRSTTYTWKSTGGTVTPSGVTASVATQGLAPGTYNVTGQISQGPKPRQNASCTSAFIIHPYDPPTLSCSVNPSSVDSGGVAKITATGMSPQNRPLTYSYTASSGQLDGSGASVNLATAGVPPGPIDIGCKVVDDQGQTVTASTQLTIVAPPLAPVVQPVSLCSVSFERDHKRPVRVDNEAKACLDDVVLSLNRDTDSKLLIIGSATPDDPADAAALRSLNVSLYLTRERQIDPARIELRTTDTAGQTATITLLPPGARYPATGTTVVDPAVLHEQGQAYGRLGKEKEKKHKK